MSYKFDKMAELQEILTFAGGTAPEFTVLPDEEDRMNKIEVFEDIRKKYEVARCEWWGGDETYEQIKQLVDQAEVALDEGRNDDAIRAFFNAAHIIEITPKPKKVIKEFEAAQKQKYDDFMSGKTSPD